MAALAFVGALTSCSLEVSWEPAETTGQSPTSMALPTSTAATTTAPTSSSRIPAQPSDAIDSFAYTLNLSGEKIHLAGRYVSDREVVLAAVLDHSRPRELSGVINIAADDLNKIQIEPIDQIIDAPRSTCGVFSFKGETTIQGIYSYTGAGFLNPHVKNPAPMPPGTDKLELTSSKRAQTFLRNTIERYSPGKPGNSNCSVLR